MSIFTRRHYLWIEAQFRASISTTKFATDREILRDTINQFAAALAAESPGFNRDEFITAIYNSQSDADQIHSRKSEIPETEHAQ